MNLIKIGNRYINLDNVTNISPVTINPEYAGGEGIFQIEYIGRNSEDWGSEWVQDEEAQALIQYLDERSNDIVKMYQRRVQLERGSYVQSRIDDR